MSTTAQVTLREPIMTARPPAGPPAIDDPAGMRAWCESTMGITAAVRAVPREVALACAERLRGPARVLLTCELTGLAAMLHDPLVRDAVRQLLQVAQIEADLAAIAAADEENRR